MRRLSRETGAQPECASLCRTLCTGPTCILLYTSAVLTDNLPSYQDSVLFWRWVWEYGLFESPASIRHIAHSYPFIVNLSRISKEMLCRVWFHVQTQNMYLTGLWLFILQSWFQYTLPTVTTHRSLHTSTYSSQRCKPMMSSYDAIDGVINVQKYRLTIQKIFSNPKNNTNDVARSFRFCLPSPLSTI